MPSPPSKSRSTSFWQPPHQREVQRLISQIRERCDRSLESLNRSVKRYCNLPKSVQRSEHIPAIHRESCRAFLAPGESAAESAGATMYGGMLEVLQEQLAEAQKVLDQGETENARQMAMDTARFADEIGKEVSLLAQGVNALERELKRLAEM